MNIIEALDDPSLFAPHFRGDTWGPWRAFLAALFALPMSDAALELYQAHTGRQTAPMAPFKEAALIIGRRGGKSRVLAAVAVFLACFRDYAPHLAPGEVPTIGVLAADRRQARTVFRYTLGLLQKVPLLAGEIVDETADTIMLRNGTAIEIGTASLRSSRGYTYAAVIADESAFWRSDETSANPDSEIFRALRPGMATIPGAILLNASSPYRKRGVLWEAYRRHYGKDDAPVLVWQAPTLAMNPGLDPAIVAEAYESDPEAAEAEYGARFRSDLSDFVSREAVEACVIPGRIELPRATRHVAFVDPSGGSADAMTLAIAHNESGVAVLDAVRERKPPFSPEDVVQDFAAVLKSYGLSSVTGDRYAGEWPRERFRVHGITYDLSERTKGAIYMDALPLLNSRKVELLEHRTLISQLCGLERRTARGGRDSIDHAPGSHDDVANAALGALLLAGGGSSFDSLYGWVNNDTGPVLHNGQWV